jgi:hypothetical protein
MVIQQIRCPHCHGNGQTVQQTAYGQRVAFPCQTRRASGVNEINQPENIGAHLTEFIWYSALQILNKIHTLKIIN